MKRRKEGRGEREEGREGETTIGNKGKQEKISDKRKKIEKKGSNERI